MTVYAIYSILPAEPNLRKPLFWMGSSFEDLLALPKEVRHKMGFALRVAQEGGKHRHAKIMRGFKGSSVLEIVADYDRNAFRAVYGLSFKEAVYVLHVFQKKSSQGMETPKRDSDQIRRRLLTAQEHHAKWSESHAKENT